MWILHQIVLYFYHDKNQLNIFVQNIGNTNTGSQPVNSTSSTSTIFVILAEYTHGNTFTVTNLLPSSFVPRNRNCVIRISLVNTHQIIDIVLYGNHSKRNSVRTICSKNRL